MAPQFVKPYVKTNKTDAADAEAICEAVNRPGMRFVPIKSIENQTLLALHRARQGFIKARVAQTNQIRGFLAEFGIVIPQGPKQIEPRVPGILEDAENELPQPGSAWCPDSTRARRSGLRLRKIVGPRSHGKMNPAVDP